MSRKKEYLWLQVSNDEYELPINIADTCEELAEMCGVRENAIYSAISHAKEKNYRCKYVKVKVE